MKTAIRPTKICTCGHRYHYDGLRCLAIGCDCKMFDAAPVPLETPAQQERKETSCMCGKYIYLAGDEWRHAFNDSPICPTRFATPASVNRDPAFQKLVEAAQAALVNIQGLLDNDDLPSVVIRNMLREALRLAREGETE